MSQRCTLSHVRLSSSCMIAALVRYHSRMRKDPHGPFNSGGHIPHGIGPQKNSSLLVSCLYEEGLSFQKKYKIFGTRYWVTESDNEERLKSTFLWLSTHIHITLSTSCTFSLHLICYCSPLFARKVLPQLNLSVQMWPPEYHCSQFSNQKDSPVLWLHLVSLMASKS